VITAAGGYERAKMIQRRLVGNSSRLGKKYCIYNDWMLFTVRDRSSAKATAD
jgi:hypothetical protein